MRPSGSSGRPSTSANKSSRAAHSMAPSPAWRPRASLHWNAASSSSSGSTCAGPGSSSIRAAARARTLRARLTTLGQDHARNIRDDTRSITLADERELAGLPADYVAAHRPGTDGRIRISTNPPDAQPFLAYAHSEQARKALLTASLDRAPDNVGVLQDLVRTRHELATLLGYPSWAHYNLEDRMAGTPEALDRFLSEIEAIARPPAQRELALLLEEKRGDDPTATRIGEWDHQYYLNWVKGRRFRFDAKDVRPYLEYRAVVRRSSTSTASSSACSSPRSSTRSAGIRPSRAST